MFALVDVNAFYASCETIFRPDLQGRPVVMLSNNNGCMIARTAEAKALGIAMGAPYFKIKGELRSMNCADKTWRCSLPTMHCMPICLVE